MGLIFQRANHSPAVRPQWVAMGQHTQLRCLRLLGIPGRMQRTKGGFQLRIRGLGMQGSSHCHQILIHNSKEL